MSNFWQFHAVLPESQKSKDKRFKVPVQSISRLANRPAREFSLIENIA